MNLVKFSRLSFANMYMLYSSESLNMELVKFIHEQEEIDVNAKDI